MILKPALDHSLALETIFSVRTEVNMTKREINKYIHSNYREMSLDTILTNGKSYHGNKTKQSRPKWSEERKPSLIEKN